MAPFLPSGPFKVMLRLRCHENFSAGTDVLPIIPSEKVSGRWKWGLNGYMCFSVQMHEGGRGHPWGHVLGEQAPAHLPVT